MAKKPTYEKLKQTVKELKGETTDRKRAALATQEAREYAENIVETVTEPLVVLDGDLRQSSRRTVPLYFLWRV